METVLKKFVKIKREYAIIKENHKPVRLHIKIKFKEKRITSLVAAIPNFKRISSCFFHASILSEISSCVKSVYQSVFVQIAGA